MTNNRNNDNNCDYFLQTSRFCFNVQSRCLVMVQKQFQNESCVDVRDFLDVLRTLKYVVTTPGLFSYSAKVCVQTVHSASLYILYVQINKLICYMF